MAEAKVEDQELSPEDAVKLINMANMFAGDVVKKWALDIMTTDDQSPKLKDVFPDGWLKQVAVTRMVSQDKSKVFELRLEVVPASYRLDAPPDISLTELGRQITYLLTMVRTYLQYATQKYDALKVHPWLYTSLVPSTHGTVYSIGIPDKKHIGVVITRKPATTLLMDRAPTEALSMSPA